MLLLRSETLPEGTERIYELKPDGYRALGIKAFNILETNRHPPESRFDRLRSLLIE